MRPSGRQRHKHQILNIGGGGFGAPIGDRPLPTAPARNTTSWYSQHYFTYYMDTTDLRLLPALRGAALHALTLTGTPGYHFIQLLHEHHRPASAASTCQYMR